jgi:hypothetical protein
MRNLADEDFVPGESTSIGDAISGSVNQKDDLVSFILQIPSWGKLKLLSKSIGQKQVGMAIFDFCDQFVIAGVKLEENWPLP